MIQTAEMDLQLAIQTGLEMAAHTKELMDFIKHMGLTEDFDAWSEAKFLTEKNHGEH